MSKTAVLLLIVGAALAGLSAHNAVNCADADGPEICTAVIAYSPLRGSMLAFAYEGRADIEFRHGDVAAAVADFTRAIALDPARASAVRGRADAFRQSGDFARAVADYDQAIAIQPGTASFYFNRGLALLAQGDADRAILSLGVAIRLSPNDPGPRLARAAVLSRRGAVAAALADYREVLGSAANAETRAEAQARVTQLLKESGGRTELPFSRAVDANATPPR